MPLDPGKMYRPTTVTTDITNNAVYVVEQFNHRISKWIYEPDSFVFSLANGNVTNLLITETGSNGYFSGALLVIEGPTGTAKADATVSGGAVTTIAVTDGGSDYTTAPNVEIVAIEGSGATATANISDGSVTSITITNGGSLYITATQVTPLVVIDAPEGKSRATGTVDVDLVIIENVVLTSNGNGYDEINPDVSIVSDFGNNGTAAITATANITAWGSNGDGTSGEGAPIGDGGVTDNAFYRPTGIAFDLTNSRLYVTDTFHNRVRVVNSADGEFVSSFGIGGLGTTNFYRPAGIAINESTGTTLVIADEFNHRAVKYDVNGGSPNNATVLEGPSGIHTVIIDTPGNGFTGTQTVTIAASTSGGITATGTANIGGTVINSILITNPGSGYIEGESVTFSGGAGNDVAGIAVISDGAVQSIVFTNRGNGYNELEPITINGDISGSSNATFEPQSTAGNGLQSISVVTAGTGYSGVSTVTIVGTVGSGATASAISGGLSFIRPHGVVYDITATEFNVGDSQRSVISSYNVSGIFQNQYGTPGTTGTDLFFPASGEGILSAGTNTIFADTRNNDLKTMNNEIIAITTGTTPGIGDGQLFHPESASSFLDSVNYVLAVNTRNHRVEAYSSAVAALIFQKNFGSPFTS